MPPTPARPERQSSPASPLSSTSKTDPDPDPSATTTMSCLENYSSLLVGLPCFLPCLVQSLLHTQPKGSLCNTKSDSALLCSKPCHGSQLTWSQSQPFFNGTFSALLPMWPPCFLLFSK